MQGATGTRLLSRNKLPPPEMPALPEHLQASPDNCYINTIATHDNCHDRSLIISVAYFTHQTKKQRPILDAFLRERQL